MSRCRENSRSFRWFSLKKDRICLFFSQGIIIGTLALLYAVLGSSSKPKPTLEFLGVIHRHGERAPLLRFPTDPYDAHSFWPEGRGELSKMGIMSLFKNGQFLRQRYDGFLPSEYKTDQLNVRSSDLNRTIMSAQALLAGLYPPVGDQIWNSDLPWQPIPVHVIPQENDDMIFVSKSCPLLDDGILQFLKTDGRKVAEANKDLLDFISSVTQLEAKDITFVYGVYEYLEILEERGLKAPDWATKLSRETLRNISHEVFLGNIHTLNMKKCHCGVLLRDLLESMVRRKEGSPRLLNIYSGHDGTIYFLRHCLNITEETPIVLPGAMLIIELHKINSEYRIKILYKHRQQDKDAAVLNLKGCEEDEKKFEDQMCDLDVFAEVIKPLTIPDFVSVCNEKLEKTDESF